MNWFYLALIGPIFWSISNHIDKFIVSKYFNAGGLGSIIIFTAFFSFLVLPFILIFDHSVFNILPLHSGILVLLGGLSMVQLMIYFFALKEDSASVIVPLFQITPITTFIISYFVLGEVLSLKQILAGLFIIFGALFLSLDLTDNFPKLKGKVLALMVLDCVMISIIAVIFKKIALQESFWVSTFWIYLGESIFGMMLLIFVRRFREQIIRVVKSNSKLVLSLNVFNETIALIAALATSFATLLAPVALVNVVNGFQPFFVLVFGVMLTIFFPKYGSESLVKKHLIQKGIAVLIIFIGTYSLNI